MARWLRPRWFLPALVAAALALGACGDDGDGGEDTATADPTDSTDPTEPIESTDPTESADGNDEAVASAGEEDAGSAGDLFPDVIGVSAEQAADGSWTFDVTLSSPYDSPERYADAWRVVGPDGAVYGIRELAHDHASEQPFTRSQSGIVIPDGVTAVVVEGRDQVSGWGGATMDYELGS